MELIQNIVANLSGKVRHDTMEGRPYVVAPMVMMVEGVLVGNEGPLLYPEEEMKKVPAIWNHKPVVVYHPKINGKGVSACSPEILSTHKIGVIMNTRYEDGKLLAEAWMESSRIDLVDPRINEALENDTTLELSTGLFTENEAVSGEFNDVSYDGIARNYRPDHLAILPDKKGACSIEDGAGFLRLNEAEPGQSVVQDFKAHLEAAGIDTTKLVGNELSHSSIWSMLSTDLRTRNEDAWIEEVYDSFYIYSLEGELFKQSYTSDEASVMTVGDPIKVMRVIEYRTETGIFVSNRKDFNMNKLEMVNALIANAELEWNEDDRPFLMGLEDTNLAKMSKVENADTETEVETKETPAAAADKVEPTENKTADVTLDSYIANAPPELQGVLRNSVISYAAEKKRLINTITANEKNTFTAEVLGKMEVDALTPIAALCSNAVTETPLANLLNFSGQGEVTQVTNTESDQEPLGLPSMEFPAKV